MSNKFDSAAAIERLEGLVASVVYKPSWVKEVCSELTALITAWKKRPPSAITGRGRSENQSIGTPRDLLRAIQEFFGPIGFDLAASFDNFVHPKYLTQEEDALNQLTRWPKYRQVHSYSPRVDDDCIFRSGPFLWLNPPYFNIEPWLERCQQEMDRDRHILVLIPASIGSKWWRKWVEDTWGKTGKGPYWLSLGRLKFVGQKTEAPRDMALLIYSKTWNPWGGKLVGEQFGVNPYQFFEGRNTGYLGKWDWQAFLKKLTGAPIT